MNAAHNVAALLLSLFDSLNTGAGIFTSVPYFAPEGEGRLITRTGHKGSLEVMQIGDNTRIRWLGQRGRPHLVKPGQSVLNAHKWFSGFQPLETEAVETLTEAEMVPNWEIVDTSVAA